MSRDILQRGLLQGKLPGQKKESLFYLEVSSTHLHIYEGHEDLSQSRMHLRSLEIYNGDLVGEERSRNRREYKFYAQRADGRYVFKCNSHEQREEWIMQLQRVINKREFQQIPDFVPPSADTFNPDNVSPTQHSLRQVDVPRVPKTPPSHHHKQAQPRAVTRGTSFSVGDRKVSALNQPLPPLPTDDQRASVLSNDSGIGPSIEGEVRRTPPSYRPGSSSVPSSGDGKFRRDPVQSISSSGASKSQSDGGRFDVRHRVEVVDDPEELENYRWFWGCMSRPECEKKLKSEGKVGNFVIRINANGDYIMSFWRADGVHHHKILRYANIYRFERAAVNAEGESLVDLLDTYMKNCSDKTIRPYGGGLYLLYDDPWNPPEIDMLQLQERLREQKLLREDKSPTHSPMVKQPRPKDRYSPVELDTGVKSKSNVTKLQPAEPKFNFRDDQFTDTKKTPLLPPPLDRRDIKDDNGGKKINPTQQSSMNKPLPQLPPEASSQSSRMNKPLPATPTGLQKTDESRSHLQAQKRPLSPANKDSSTKKENLTDKLGRAQNKPFPRPRKLPPAVATKPMGRNLQEQNFTQQNAGQVEEQPKYMNLAEVSASKEHATEIAQDSSQKGIHTRSNRNYTQQEPPQEVHYMNIGSMPMKSKNSVSALPSYQNLEFSGPKIAPPRDMKRH